MIGIYKISNIKNEKVYIGQSRNIEQRIKDHKIRPFHSHTESNSPIHRAIKKHGLEHFIFEVIEECPKEQLDTREIYWISFYNSTNRDVGYNLQAGGSGSTVYKFSQEVIDQLSDDLENTDVTYENLANKYNMSIGFVSDFNNGKIRHNEKRSYPIRVPKQNIAPKISCQVCNKEIDKSQKYCVVCYGSFRRKDWPRRDVLKGLLKKESFCEIGRRYNVTDNAVRKWCDAYSLPRRRVDIISLSDSEWENL